MLWRQIAKIAIRGFASRSLKKIKPKVELKPIKIKGREDTFCLADYEYHAKLAEEGKLPEQRLVQEMKVSKPEEVLRQCAKHFSGMLTKSIVNIAEIAAKQTTIAKDMKDFWVEMEAELINRTSNLTDDDLCKVLDAFSTVNKGSEKFYVELEALVVDSEFLLAPHYLLRILECYHRVNFGSGIFLREMAASLIDHGKVKLISGRISNTPVI